MTNKSTHHTGKKPMKRLTKLEFLVLAFLSLICFTGCQDTNLFEPLEDVKTINNQLTSNFFNELQTPKFTFQFDASTDYTCILPDASQILFKANSFTLNGTLVTSKLIRITIQQFSHKNDMITSNVTTMTSDRLLELAGMFKITADLEGKELQLAKNAKYNIRIPKINLNNVPTNLELFYGTVTGGILTWREADNDPSSQNNVVTSEWRYKDSVFVGLSCFPQELNWINCDHYIFNNNPRTDVCFTIKTINNNDYINFGAYCAFPKFNSVSTICCDNNGKSCFNAMPVGEDVRIILIGKGKYDYYLGYVNHNIKVGSNLTIQCDRVSFDAVKTFLSSL